jgi:GTPase SAR1 family protein
LAGQDRFQGLARIYYRDAFGAFVVFDVMNPNSFESARRWKMDIDSKVFLRDGSKIPVILLGNKVPARFIPMCVKVILNSCIGPVRFD